MKKKDNNENILSTQVPLDGKLYELISSIFENSDSECKIPIYFVPENDAQENEIRNHILDFIKDRKVDKGNTIVQRLGNFTTRKSGTGLVFLVFAQKANTKKFLLSRFPAVEGITTQIDQESLSVEFVERVFMKNIASYKAVIYQGKSIDSDFWDGNAVDNQIRNNVRELSDYWIRDFLNSEFKTTPKAGTKRLAKALKTAITKTDNIKVKREIVASAVLAENLNNTPISVREYCQNYNLSNEAKQKIYSELPRVELADESFLFDQEEFNKHALFKSIELDNGGILTAPMNDFDECFPSERIKEDDDLCKFTTQGRVINTKIKSRV